MDNSIQFEKQYFDEEVKRSFQNVNYSQWERRKSIDVKAVNVVKGIISNTTSSFGNVVKNFLFYFLENRRPSKSAAKVDKKCSKLCNHGEFVTANKSQRVRKTKKQLLKEEENNKILSVKIQSKK
jgi:hypothetical protein